MDSLALFFRSIFIDNMIFAYYLGMCSFLAVSKNVKTSFGLGIAVTFILTCTLPINYLLETKVFKQGALDWLLGAQAADVDLSFLSFIIFIAVIAAFTQLVEMLVERFSPSLYASLGIFLPLIAVNCAILGGSLFMQQREFPTIGEATIYGLGSGIGWMLATSGWLLSVRSSSTLMCPSPCVASGSPSSSRRSWGLPSSASLVSRCNESEDSTK